ncbi:MAG TPA: DUF2264 domain-containing protein [Opitutaceae bacterium]|jgi:hypothetical protein
MTTRRDFLKLAATGGMGLIGERTLALEKGSAATPAPLPLDLPTGEAARAHWLHLAHRLAYPILNALSRRKFRAEFPVEHHPDSPDRARYTHLEALARMLSGLAPWLELGADGTAEGIQRAELTELAARALDAASDPSSPDFMNFSRGDQPLVDAAFLAQAFLRAPTALWTRLEPRIQGNLIAALRSSRSIRPYQSNWELFATEIEVWLGQIGQSRQNDRLDHGLRDYAKWYLGDGIYGDGPVFHWDYYNSFVIHPMLFESLDAVASENPAWNEFRTKHRQRLSRYAAIQERLIAPDGSYPAVGRSITYRCGAFHALALAAWRGWLPESVSPAQARVGLTRAIRRTLEASGTWDDRGWLRIGLCGHQPALGEKYISTGSLYLCSEAFLPLGLPANHPFWTDANAATTWEKIWSGQDAAADHAI